MPETDTKPALSVEERSELAARAALITQYRRTADLLDSERRLFLNFVLSEKGLDPNKAYDMDPETGELTEREPSG